MKKTVSIIGGGPAGLMLAGALNPALFEVMVFEKNKSFGRKFLVAGKGGFNLTHGEALEAFIDRYTPTDFLAPALRNFSNEDLRRWLEAIGIPTFVGSSNRVYPLKGIKPIEVLTHLLDFLLSKGVQFQFEKEWKGWNDQQELIFQSGETVKSDLVIFALGGGSWKVTGSDGSWKTLFEEKGIQTAAFKPANCAYQVAWQKDFTEKNAGKPLKNIALTCGSKTLKGELVVTDFGLEGNAIYALSPAIQSALDSTGKAQLQLDLKPQLSLNEISEKLGKSKLKITETLAKELNLSRTQIDLIKSVVSKETFLDKEQLASALKALPLMVLAAAPLDEAISTTGGIALSEVDEFYQLKQLPQHYCLGEMLDWNAPTGGYLLQACFSMGVYLAEFLNKSEGI
ncbi:MAG: TIGR03862 family flavoprotein [Crocinitomicaceae bacterium]